MPPFPIIPPPVGPLVGPVVELPVGPVVELPVGPVVELPDEVLQPVSASAAKTPRIAAFLARTGRCGETRLAAPSRAASRSMSPSCAPRRGEASQRSRGAPARGLADRSSFCLLYTSPSPRD